MFDITSLRVKNTADMPVTDAAGDPVIGDDGNPLSITLFSPGTKQFRQARYTADKKSSARVMAQMQGKPDGKETADTRADERAEFLASVTESFNGFSYGTGTGQAMFRDFYRDGYLYFVADAADKFLGEAGNFKPASTTPPVLTSVIQPGSTPA